MNECIFLLVSFHFHLLELFSQIVKLIGSSIFFTHFFLSCQHFSYFIPIHICTFLLLHWTSYRPFIYLFIFAWIQKTRVQKGRSVKTLRCICVTVSEISHTHTYQHTHTHGWLQLPQFQFNISNVYIYENISVFVFPAAGTQEGYTLTGKYSMDRKRRRRRRKRRRWGAMRKTPLY